MTSMPLLASLVALVLALPAAADVRRDGTIAKIERGYAKDLPATLLGEIQAGLGFRAVPARSTSKE